jgi:hypothetical protein
MLLGARKAGRQEGRGQVGGQGAARRPGRQEGRKAGRQEGIGEDIGEDIGAQAHWYAALDSGRQVAGPGRGVAARTAGRALLACLRQGRHAAWWALVGGEECEGGEGCPSIGRRPPQRNYPVGPRRGACSPGG